MLTTLQGTVFRVFDTITGEKKHELRRGYASYANIQSLTFNVCLARVIIATRSSSLPPARCLVSAGFQ